MDVRDFRLEKDADGTYLLYDIKETDKMDEQSMGMLLNNEIPGTLKMILFAVDKKQTIKFNLSSYVTLQKFVLQTMNKKKSITIFSEICSALIQAGEYMIEAQQAVLDTEYIFVDVQNMEVKLIFLPLEAEEAEVDYKRFFKELMMSSIFDTRENTDYIVKISTYLNTVEHFSISDFRDFVNGLNPIGVNTGSRAASPESNVPTNANIMDRVRANKSEYEKKQPLPSGNMQSVILGGGNEGNSQFGSNKGFENAQPPAPEKSSGSWFGGKNKAKEQKEKNSSQLTPNMSGFQIPGGGSVPSNAGSGKDAPGFAIPSQNKGNPPKTEKVKPEKPKKEKSFWPFFGKKKKAEPEIPEMKIPKPSDVAIGSASYGTGNSAGTGQGKAQVYGGGYNAGMSGSAGSDHDYTVLMDDSDKTMFIGGESMNRLYLFRRSTGENIFLNKAEFWLGKKRGAVDFVFEDNTISKKHAVIYNKGGKYYICDINSTNHTYLNGNILEKGAESEILEGDVIRLSGYEELEVRKQEM